MMIFPAHHFFGHINSPQNEQFARFFKRFALNFWTRADSSLFVLANSYKKSREITRNDSKCTG